MIWKWNISFVTGSWPEKEAYHRKEWSQGENKNNHRQNQRYDNRQVPERKPNTHPRHEENKPPLLVKRGKIKIRYCHGYIILIQFHNYELTKIVFKNNIIENDTPSKPVKPPEPQGEKITIDDLIKPPGRNSRPPKLVIILRGLPGAGKTFIVKHIKSQESEMGGDAPRILSLDDYFECDGEV